MMMMMKMMSQPDGSLDLLIQGFRGVPCLTDRGSTVHGMCLVCRKEASKVVEMGQVGNEREVGGHIYLSKAP